MMTIQRSKISMTESLLVCKSIVVSVFAYSSKTIVSFNIVALALVFIDLRLLLRVESGRGHLIHTS